MAVLLGRTSAGTTADFESSGNAMAWEFSAVASGELATIFFQTKVSNAGITSVELGIYTDAGTIPGTKLGSALVSSGFTGTAVFSATLSPTVTVNSGTQYWLAVLGIGSENFDFQGDSSGAYSVDTSLSSLAATWVQFSTGAVNAIIWGESADAPEATTVPQSALQGARW